MKKIDKLVLNSFFGPFILTFLVVVFILLNIQMLKYFDDIIGKGLEWSVVGKLLFYFAVFTTPTAMPLAVLLSSLITFGNLGEHFELTAIKSAGISLLRTLQPIFFFVLVLTGFAFYINNNLVPKAALEAYSLLYDIKQKKPALELREGAFYMGIPDVSIKINKKFSKDESALKGVVIYDHRKNEGNKEVTVADSGRMYTILNERYLKLELYKGYYYTEGTSGDQELTGQRGKNSPTSLSRSQFAKTQVVFDLSSFNLQTTDKKWFQGNRIMRNLSELDGDIDSLTEEVLGQQVNYYSGKSIYFLYYNKNDSSKLAPELQAYIVRRDSALAKKFTNVPHISSDNSPVTSPDRATLVKPKIEPDTTQEVTHRQKEVQRASFKPSVKSSVPMSTRLKPTGFMKRNKTIPVQKQENVIVLPKKPKITDSLIAHRIDSVFGMDPSSEHIQKAANDARQVKSQVLNSNSMIENYEKDRRVYEIQWHRIIANSLACIAMFLIGAPLGAIIKKGGLGVPFLVSIVFFILFYIMNMIGEKWAKQGVLDVVTGVWLADFILLFIGLFFLRQARIDARLFDTDFYLVVWDKFKRWLKVRKAEPIKTI